jgi:tRNA 2-selenouridine synthase
MPIQRVDITQFIDLVSGIPVFDVRSPSEFSHAHIPGAFSFPIFSDEERRVIGTAYKQQSREQAIKLGLDFFGRKMAGMVGVAEEYFEKNKVETKEVAVHCWRGGMRSSAIAWLLDLYGFKVTLLQGGYKAYRNWVLQQFELDYPLLVVGGCTGGNKTGLLHALKNYGERILDLEDLAGHKGSAFGNLEGIPQPSQEQFENLLAGELHELNRKGPSPIWVEGESQRIGNVNLPMGFHKTMRNSVLLFLDIPFEERLKHIVNGYGKYPKEKLMNATVRIKKRLGGLETKNAVNALLEDDVETCFRILLHYYDKLYLKSTYNKEMGERQIIKIECSTVDVKQNLQKVLAYGQTKQF